MEMVTLSLLKETKELSPVKVILEPLSLDNLVSQDSHLNPDSPINLETKVNKSSNHHNLVKAMPVPLNLVNKDNPVNHNNQTKAIKDNSLRKSTLALRLAHLVALIHLEA